MPRPTLTLLLPFALPPAEHARDLIAQLRAPALANMLARASGGMQAAPSAFQACLPHERWLSAHAQDNSPAMAHATMQAMGLAASEGWWFVLQPVHLHVARDHLVLTDYRQLNLAETEARSLFDAAAPLFAEQAQTLVYGNATLWFLRADSWAGLRTCTPDAACGHNIDIWLPSDSSGSLAREWRRAQNEVQMLWHQHPVNEARDRQGMQRINALWLWGGSGSPAAASEGEQQMAAQLVQPDIDRCHSPGQAGVRLIDSLLPGALADDWSEWLRQMAALDQNCFAPALAALSDGKLDAIRLVMSDSTRLAEWTLTRSSMRKFWVRSSLSRLAP